MREKIIVTGAKGYIGKAISSTLKRQGYFVIGVDVDDEEYEGCNASIPCDLTKKSAIDALIDQLAKDGTHDEYYAWSLQVSR
jgi:nucleoside-diphosphate-sugar epimerase